MARYRKISVGILNIKIHPHSDMLYVNLFNTILNSKRIAKIRGSYAGMMGYLRSIKQDEPEAGMYGLFYRFIDISQNDPWFDLKTTSPILDEEGKPIPQIPEHLKPNCKEIYFVFYPRVHRLVFHADYFSPNSAQKLLQNLCAQDIVISKFGEVDVIVETSQEAMERILRIPKLTKLQIFITRPNGDDITEQETEFMRRLENQNIRSSKCDYTSDKDKGIKPDEGTKTLMRMALSNGHIKAIGWDGEKKIEESTTPHPLIIKDRYSTDTPFLVAFKELANHVIKRFMR
ncbi:DUF4747 family protein [Desulfovulcanus sp.]